MSGDRQPRTVRIVAETSASPESVLRAARDFSQRRADVWPSVSVKHLEVHELADTTAGASEGTRFGVLNWERCRYDWSQPGSVTALVKDSNVYEPEASSWEIKATSKDGGSEVEMIWVRAFRGGLRGTLFGTVYRLAGKPLLGYDARRVLKRLEKGV